MFKLNSLAACSSPSDPNKDRIRDVVDLFGVDATSGDILQLHLEQDVWTRARIRNPYAEQGTRFSGPITATALNQDRVNLLGSGPQGEMLHCYTDPQVWSADPPRLNSLVPNSQTTAVWWNDGQNRLDLFSVSADRSQTLQYTAVDPGNSKSYTWISTPQGNPALFTDGPLTSLWPWTNRIDIFGVQATGKATQLYYQWPVGWQWNPDFSYSYPVGTNLVSCARRKGQWDVFGIDENGKILSFYYYWGDGWATRQLDMPVSGDWKLSAGCARAADKIDLFFIDAAGGILRVAITDMDKPTFKLDAELIYPFVLRQTDLEKFKTMFPKDDRLQKLSLDDLVKYSQGKDRDGSTAQPSSDPPPHSKRDLFTPCEWQTGVCVLDVVFLTLGLWPLVKKGLFLDEAIAVGAGLKLPIEHTLETIADSSASMLTRANAVREVLALIWSGGLIEPIYKAIVKSLTWWDMVLYGVAGMAEISAAFLTDGAALIALIIYDLSVAAFLVTDIEKRRDICNQA